MTYQNQWQLYISRLFGIGANGLVLCEVFRNDTKPSFGLQTKITSTKTNININLKPKIIAKHLLANRLFIPKINERN